MIAPPVGIENAREYATDLKRRWRRGETADAAAVVAERPDLAQFKSIVIDLAYEEYLLREKAGAAPDAGSFANRFPMFRASIRNMLDAHRLLLERPELLDSAAGAWPDVGSRLEGLDLVAELGRGAFGRAYLAFDPATDRLCVVKLTAGGSAEARVIGRLSHPHVTDVYWARPAGSRTAVCMPFVGVSTLADVISAAFPDRDVLPPPTARVILDAAEADGLAGQADRRSVLVVRPGEEYVVGACALSARIADAVGYLHKEGVVHGDLKPSNVVVGPGGAPHLIDFNLASRDAARLDVRGTPEYMAPELLEAALAHRSMAGINAVRADLFSLGVVAFELLTGRLPFPVEGQKTLPALAAATRTALPVIPPTLPAALAAILTACLARDPASRPASAGEVAAALDRFVRDRRGRARNRFRMAVASVCLVLVGCAAAVVAKEWPSGTQSVSLVEDRSPETAADFFLRGQKFLRAGDLNAAGADFLRSYERSRDPKVKALVAYCYALDGKPVASMNAGRQAIKEGWNAAEVNNNLGYVLAQSSRPEDAIAPLDEALRLAPGMQAALYNRAIARYRIGLNIGNVDRRAADDIAAALAAGPASSELHFDAARIYAACSSHDPSLRADAMEQIKAAIRAGKDPAQCKRDAILKAHLGSDPEFSAACDMPRGNSQEKPTQLRLAEPRF